jgi:hypothetical protein
MDSHNANPELAYNEWDVVYPQKWVERLSTPSLKVWLRNALWLRAAGPVEDNPGSSMGEEIGKLLKEGSSRLKLRVHEVLTQLLQEWGRDDPSAILSDLLTICARVRCVSAEATITLMLTERLGGRGDEVSLRRECLNVLSGFGCTRRTLHIFKRYLGDIEYTATCYKALYRYHISYAATEFLDVYRVFRAANAIQELKVVLHRLLSDYPEAKQRVELLTVFLKKADPEGFPLALHLLKNIEDFSLESLLAINPNQRAGLFKLLLKRTRLEDMSDVVSVLKAIGIEIQSIKPRGEKEHIAGLYETPADISREPEPLFPISSFKIGRAHV